MASVPATGGEQQQQQQKGEAVAVRSVPQLREQATRLARAGNTAVVAARGVDAHARPCVWVGPDSGLLTVFVQLPTGLQDADAVRAAFADALAAGKRVPLPRSSLFEARAAASSSSSQEAVMSVLPLTPELLVVGARARAQLTPALLAALMDAVGRRGRSRTTSPAGGNAPHGRAASEQAAGAPARARDQSILKRAASAQPPQAPPPRAATAAASSQKPAAAAASVAAATPAAPPRASVPVPPDRLLPVCLVHVPVPVPSKTKLADLTRTLYGTLVQHQPELGRLRLAARHMVRLPPDVTGGKHAAGEVFLVRGFVADVMNGAAVAARPADPEATKVAAAAGKTLAGVGPFRFNALSSGGQDVICKCDVPPADALTRAVAECRRRGLCE
jgi:hypothetical protein